jgi:hypothetical protein
MIITPFRAALIPAVEHLIGLGAPYVRRRTSSDYWLYAELFSSTCPVAVNHDDVFGIVIAFRSQDTPGDVYVQDVVTHPTIVGAGSPARWWTPCASGPAAGDAGVST